MKQRIAITTALGIAFIVNQGTFLYGRTALENYRKGKIKEYINAFYTNNKTNPQPSKDQNLKLARILYPEATIEQPIKKKSNSKSYCPGFKILLAAAIGAALCKSFDLQLPGENINAPHLPFINTSPAFDYTQVCFGYSDYSAGTVGSNYNFTVDNVDGKATDRQSLLDRNFALVNEIKENISRKQTSLLKLFTDRELRLEKLKQEYRAINPPASEKIQTSNVDANDEAPRKRSFMEKVEIALPFFNKIKIALPFLFSK